MKRNFHIQITKSRIQASIQCLIILTFILGSGTLFSQNQNSNVDGGFISTNDNTTICLDSEPDPIHVTVVGDSGRQKQWIITDDQNNILALPESPPFDLNGASVGVCRIWHLAYNGIPPFKHLDNLSDLRGRYDLSNYIEVTRQQSVGGTLEGGPFSFCVGDGEVDNIPEGAITLSGDSGTNSQWVITDSNGNILGLPPSPYVVNFDGAGEGTCLIWHLSYEDGLEGAEMGANAADLMGCYSLSNPISVIRTQPEGGTLEGGPFSFCVGDGEVDNILEGAITLSGNSGTNSQWVITDSNGNILGLPPSPYVVNFDGAGEGTCLIWHLSYEDGIEGAEMGANAADLMGCYSLSNSISVLRTEDLNKISMYPNPTSSMAKIKLPEFNKHQFNITVYDTYQVMLFNKKIDLVKSPMKHVEVDLSGFKIGTYIVVIIDETTGEKIVKKLLKKN